MNISDLTNESFTNYALTKQINKLHNYSITTSCGGIVLTNDEVEKLKLFLISLLERR